MCLVLNSFSCVCLVWAAHLTVLLCMLGSLLLSKHASALLLVCFCAPVFEGLCTACVDCRLAVMWAAQHDCCPRKQPRAATYSGSEGPAPALTEAPRQHFDSCFACSGEGSPVRDRCICCRLAVSSQLATVLPALCSHPEEV
jgi:hypothetical protein